MNTDLSPEERTELGKIVREVWIAWATQLPAAMQYIMYDRTVSWDNLNDAQREVDRRIGETLFQLGVVSGGVAALQVATKELRDMTRTVLDASGLNFAANHLERAATNIEKQITAMQRGTQT